MSDSDFPLTTCFNCGENISSNWLVCPVCAHTVNQSVDKTASNDPMIKADTLLLCIKCEKEIAPDAQICPHCHAPIIRRYCSGCHRLIPDHASLCPYCRAPSTFKPRFRKTSIIAALSVLVTIGLILTVFHERDSQLERSRNARPAELGISKKHPELKPTKEVIIKPEPSPVMETKIEATVQAVNLITTDQEDKQSDVDPELESRGQRLLLGRKLNQVGLKLLRKGQYEKAALVFTDAVQSFPPETKDLSYGEALFYLGYSFRMAGMPEKAIPILKRALNFPYYRNKAVRELQTSTLQVKSD